MPDFSDTRLAAPNEKTPLRGQIRSTRAKLIKANENKSSAECVTAVFYGEQVDMYSHNKEYALVRTKRDHYVGWIPAKELGEVGSVPTHRIAVPMTYAYLNAGLKSVPKTTLFQGSLVTAGDTQETFTYCGAIGWVPNVHLVPVDVFAADPAAQAERFIGAPYLWGGCDLTGIDCSGLTQIAFGACGLRLPRDSDMQFAWCGRPIEDWDRPDKLQRNDLVFWKGHVGIMLDADQVLHANAYHMAVAVEPLVEAVDRIARLYGYPIGARRLALDGSDSRTWYESVQVSAV